MGRAILEKEKDSKLEKRTLKTTNETCNTWIDKAHPHGNLTKNTNRATLLYDTMFLFIAKHPSNFSASHLDLENKKKKKHKDITLKISDITKINEAFLFFFFLFYSDSLMRNLFFHLNESFPSTGIPKKKKTKRFRFFFHKQLI